MEEHGLKTDQTVLPGVQVIEPAMFGDHRGFLMESYNRRTFRELTGFDGEFVQENHSLSSQHVLRGLHYQIRQPQGKLVRVLEGEVFDVAVDLRRSSHHFGRWVGVMLSAQNRRMLWIPPGFAHGVLAISEVSQLLYKMSDYWAPEHERCIRWDDPTLGIDWPLSGAPILSEKDGRGHSLVDAEVYA